ncbi:MAG: hypothetical protein KDA29_07035 [Phycisphaerales bacterium]|nr:hypothetical protein [Phycisphaerales bacterium]
MITKFVRIALCAIAFATSITAAEPFTYQGSLKDNGVPANGEFDFRFYLYDAQTGGAQLGVLNTRENVQVTDGVFTVTLDFGLNLFQSTPRYLEIRVRPGDSVSSYNILTPRAPINPAPAAQHAFTATTLTNPIWYQESNTVGAGNGITRFLLNRDSPIHDSEYFGVHSDTPGFVGMYVSGNANSYPFYGYSVGGATSAYTYFNPNDNSWNLVGSKLAIGLTLNENNNVVVANDIQAESFQYETPKLHRLSISKCDFVCDSGQNIIDAGAFIGSYVSGSSIGSLVTGVRLPDGATVTRVRCYVWDTGSANITVGLYSEFHGFASESTPMAQVLSSGASGPQELIDETIDGPVIDNENYHYFLKVFSTGWSDTADLGIKSVVIEYTTTQAE